MRNLRHILFGRLFPCAAALVACAALAVCLPVFLPSALPAIACAERAFALVCAFLLLNSPALPETRSAWLILILALPWAGSIAYMVWGRRTFSAYKGKNVREERALPQTWYGENAPDRLLLECAALAQSEACPCHAASARYFGDGSQFLAPFLEDLRKAKKFLWLEFYIAAEGEFFGEVLSVMEERAAAGVDVRFLYDDLGCASLPRDLDKRLSRRGIRACAFNRAHPFRFSALNRRDHRKLAVIDGECAYTGGFNLADEYVGKKIRFGHWKDAALRVTGSAAARLAELFARQWAYRHPEELETDLRSLPKGDDGGFPCVPFADDPFLPDARVGAEIFRTLAAGAERSLYVCTPYLMPDRATAEALKTAARAGKDVRVLIPHIPDKKTAFALTRSFARELAESGVKIREYFPGFLHAKAIVCDRTHAAIGSYNLDFRSLYLQYECGALLADQTLAEAVRKDFLDAWELSVPLSPPSKAERAAAAILRPFAPLF